MPAVEVAVGEFASAVSTTVSLNFSDRLQDNSYRIVLVMLKVVSGRNQ